MNITEARKYVGQKQAGLGSDFDGTSADYQKLDPSQQVDLNYKVSSYIVSNPGKFTSEQVKQASRTANGSNSSLVDSSFDFSMFGDEVLNNARAINPLDPQNIKTVGFYLLAAALVLGVSYIYINKKS